MPNVPFNPWLLFIAAAYLVGGIPFGLLIGMARGIDIREHGSKNIGATNTWRVLGKKAGITCFILDVLKGAVPVLVSGAVMHTLGARTLDQTTSWWWLSVGIAAVLGHMFSPYIGFKGGKGVATGFGAMAAFWPHVTVTAFLALAIWIVCAKVSRMVSVSSCIAAVSMPLSLALLRLLGWPAEGLSGAFPYLGVTSILAILVVWRHRSNLVRVLNGTENKLGPKPAAEPNTH